MNYENSIEGKIISINNFSFNDGQLDHAWNTGRIGIILYSDDEYEYFAPITHSIKHMEYKNEYYPINKHSIQEYYDKRLRQSTLYYKHKMNNQNKKDIKGYIDLKKIYVIPIAYRDEIGKVNYKSYKKIIEAFHQFHKSNTKEELLESASTRYK